MFIAKTLVLLEYLVRIVAGRVPVKTRQILYNAIPGIKNDELKILLDNVSLTLGLHPWTLLMEAEETGLFIVGLGINLKLDIISNVAKAAEIKKEKGIKAVYLSQDCYYKRGFMDSRREYNVPDRIMRVRNPLDTGIKAVVVVEHRNISTRFAQLEDNMSHVMVVTVCPHRSGPSCAVC